MLFNPYRKIWYIQFQKVFTFIIDFSGEAVQVNPLRNQQQQQQEQKAEVPAPDSPRDPSASRTFPTWEKPAGF